MLLIRQGADELQVTDRLKESADRKYPLAIALLAERTAVLDQEKAKVYRSRYDELDVAKSGYPSFAQALIVVNKLISPNK